MAVRNGIDFGGSLARLIANTRGHERAVVESVNDFAAALAESLEAYARQQAPWSDVTGAARATLAAAVARQGHTTSVTLSHGVHYGIYLELKHAGRWGIVLRALQAHQPAWAAWCRANGFR